MTDPQYRTIADKDTTPDLVSTHAAPGDRLVYDVIDADRWSLVRIERQMAGADPTVQPPTPEQVADELIEALPPHVSHAISEPHLDAIAEAVRGLLAKAARQ